MPLSFEAMSVSALVAIFLSAGAVVWVAGSQLARLVDAIAQKTGLGQAFAGMLLLGGITSLPEIAAVSTSAATGNAPLAVNNLLGTASINIMLLAMADIRFGRGSITRAAAQPAVLMQGVLCMLLAAAVALIAAAGDIPLFGFGVGAALIALASVGALWLSSDFQQRHVWEIVDQEHEPDDPVPDPRSLRQVITYTIGCAIVILIGGFVLAQSADALAHQSGLSSGMVGFLLVGAATSLPEVSSISAAVRLRRFQMAIGDVFGTNIFNIMLIFLADLIYIGDPVLGRAGQFEMVGAGLATILTGIFLVGLLERRDRAVLRMGYDTVAAFVTFGLGLALLVRVSG